MSTSGRWLAPRTRRSITCLTAGQSWCPTVKSGARCSSVPDTGSPACQMTLAVSLRRSAGCSSTGSKDVRWASGAGSGSRWSGITRRSSRTPLKLSDCRLWAADPVTACMQVIDLAKSLIKNTLFPQGSVRAVLLGPCRGIRYRVFPGYGWAYIYGGWERRLVRRMTGLISPGSTVYDVGANYGMHTLLFARLVGPSGRVYAFEPHPGVFSCLKEQLDLNGFRTVVPVCKAVCEESGTGFFDETEQRSTGHLTDPARGQLRVQT